MNILQDIVEHIANVRYLMNEAITQVDKVHQLTSLNQLDYGTVLLNVKDVREQMTVVNAELQELYDTLETIVNGVDDDTRGDNRTDQN